jgi:hypothetical protein
MMQVSKQANAQDLAAVGLTRLSRQPLIVKCCSCGCRMAPKRDASTEAPEICVVAVHKRVWLMSSRRAAAPLAASTSGRLRQGSVVD